MNEISIAVISGVVGVVATLITLYKEDKKQTRTDATYTSSIREEIKYISRGVEDIRFDTKSVMTTINGINERLVRAEENIKNAHEKIDTIIRKGE